MTDTGKAFTLPDRNWQVLEDTENAWNIEEVSNPRLRDHFKSPDSLFHATDQANKVLWVRYKLFWVGCASVTFYCQLPGLPGL